MPFFKARKVSKDEAKKRVERCLVVVSAFYVYFAPKMLFDLLSRKVDVSTEWGTENFFCGYARQLIVKRY